MLSTDLRKVEKKNLQYLSCPPSSGLLHQPRSTRAKRVASAMRLNKRAPRVGLEPTTWQN